MHRTAPPSLRTLSALSALIQVLCLFMGSQAAAAAGDAFAPLQLRLTRDGFSPHHVGLVYGAKPTPLFKTVANTFGIRESKLNYGQFLQPQAMLQANRFLRDHEGILAGAERSYGVDRSVVVAILSVETRFGQYTGRTPTLDILSTFAVMDQKHHRDRVWSLLSAEEKKRWGRDAFDQKLQDRSQWAYRELCALLQIVEPQPQKAGTFRGSIMGAIGWPQFLPSSLVQYGVDGNGDGQIDLFDPHDAIFSVANYLRAHGWCQAKSRSEKEKVIYRYNKSGPYVNAVLGIAALLNREESKRLALQANTDSE